MLAPIRRRRRTLVIGNIDALSRELELISI
jgi:hypothetical protein